MAVKGRLLTDEQRERTRKFTSDRVRSLSGVRRHACDRDYSASIMWLYKAVPVCEAVLTFIPQQVPIPIIPLYFRTTIGETAQCAFADRLLSIFGSSRQAFLVVASIDCSSHLCHEINHKVPSHAYLMLKNCSSAPASNLYVARLLVCPVASIASRGGCHSFRPPSTEPD